MSKPTPATYKAFLSHLSRWPADPLRPAHQLSATLASRTNKAQAGQGMGEALTDEQLRGEIRAIAALLDNKYARKYPVSDQIWYPKSHPSYFTDIAKDLEEAPTRTWWQSRWIKMKSMIRFS